MAEATTRKVCEVLEVCRSSLYTTRHPRPRDERLKAALPDLARTQPRFGYRRLRAMVCASLEPVCEETVQRLCQLLGLQVKPLRRHRTRRKGSAMENGLRATHPGHVWCLDFLKDRTRDGRALRFLSVVDEHTRRCLALVVARRITAVDVMAVLRPLIAAHGRPEHLRSDNGPEFVATVIETWVARQGIRMVHSAPASPWQNPFAETFHSRLRDEFVERHDFGSLVEAQVLAETYRDWYNTARPHSALQYLTPLAFAVKALGRIAVSPRFIEAQA